MIGAFTNPLYRYCSSLFTLAVIHLAGTSFLMVWSHISDSMESYFIAVKAAHVVVPAICTYYVALAYQRDLMQMCNNVGYFSSVMGFLIFCTAILLTGDAIYYGLVCIPTIIDCYAQVTLPEVCDNPDNNEKIVYTVTVVVASVHILCECLIIIVAIMIRTAEKTNYTNVVFSVTNNAGSQVGAAIDGNRRTRGGR